MLQVLYNYGLMIWESLSQLYGRLYTTKLKDIFGTEGDLVNTVWEWLLDRFNLANITLFELVIGTGIMVWVVVGIVKFFKELYLG